MKHQLLSHKPHLLLIALTISFSLSACSENVKRGGYEMIQYYNQQQCIRNDAMSDCARLDNYETYEHERKEHQSTE